MSKTTLVLFVFFALLAIKAFAYVSRGDFSDPDHPGKCVIATDIILEPGTHQHPKKCARIECHGGPAIIAGCGVEMAGEGCKLGQLLQPDADYPGCCRHEVICN